MQKDPILWSPDVTVMQGWPGVYCSDRYKRGTFRNGGLIFLPYANSNSAVPIETNWRHLLEQQKNFHLTELSDVEVRHPKPVPLLPRELHVVEWVTLDPDPRILPVNLQEHIERDLLQKSAAFPKKVNKTILISCHRQGEIMFFDFMIFMMYSTIWRSLLLLLLLRVREEFRPRRRPHSGSIELRTTYSRCDSKHRLPCTKTPFY